MDDLYRLTCRLCQKRQKPSSRVHGDEGGEEEFAGWCPKPGTVQVAHLIMEGSSALEALESVRQIEPRWVQFGEQARFLERFADWLAGPREEALPKTVAKSI